MQRLRSIMRRSAAVVPSAISNVLLHAIGVRLRSVPFTADKVKPRRAPRSGHPEFARCAISGDPAA